MLPTRLVSSEAFGKYGVVTEARIAVTKSGRKRDFAFVHFKTPSMAADALNACKGEVVCGGELDIEFANPRNMSTESPAPPVGGRRRPAERRPAEDYGREKRRRVEPVAPSRGEYDIKITYYDMLGHYAMMAYQSIQAERNGLTLIEERGHSGRERGYPGERRERDRSGGSYRSFGERSLPLQRSDDRLRTLPPLRPPLSSQEQMIRDMEANRARRRFTEGWAASEMDRRRNSRGGRRNSRSPPGRRRRREPRPRSPGYQRSYR
mmetsp:Transcript_12800/g.24247  ORF Transcript_12800/g.24247 Transcript_12800/m.24247 type:complete len:264 (-) Transcript_12800:136-927(-)